MNVRDKFRKRWLGQMGYAGGDPSLVGQPIIRSTMDKMENNQSQQSAVYDRVYGLGDKPPKRHRKKRK